MPGTERQILLSGSLIEVQAGHKDFDQERTSSLASLPFPLDQRPHFCKRVRITPFRVLLRPDERHSSQETKNGGGYDSFRLSVHWPGIFLACWERAVGECNLQYHIYPILEGAKQKMSFLFRMATVSV